MNYALIGFFMLCVGTFGGWLLVRFKAENKSKQVKWALFVLYFWFLTFIQLIILAFVHYMRG